MLQGHWHDLHHRGASLGAAIESRHALPLRLIDRGFSGALDRALPGVPIAVELRDGTHIWRGAPSPLAVLVARERRTLFELLRDPELKFGEAYVDGDLEVHGDLVGALEAIERLLLARPRRSLAPIALRGPSLQESRRNVHRHYDLGNDFYSAWLDERMVYTCAYYPSPDASLDEAQLAKLDLVCGKLWLKPGEEVVEAGCGWGALALHMARHYGVRVTAYNVSREQVRYGRARAEREGLAERVRFAEDDYRNIEGRFDAFVSVGMLEHVGRAHFPTLGAVIGRCLKDDGRGLLHFIGRDRPRPINAWIGRHIFPGAYPPTLSEVSRRALEPAGLSLLDVENLRRHYSRTLAHWAERFERVAGPVGARYGERFLRAWRLYLAGSQAAFNTGSLQLFQVVFARTGSNTLPWVRGSAPPRVPRDGTL